MRRRPHGKQAEGCGYSIDRGIIFTEAAIALSSPGHPTKEVGEAVKEKMQLVCALDHIKNYGSDVSTVARE